MKSWFEKMPFLKFWRNEKGNELIPNIWQMRGGVILYQPPKNNIPYCELLVDVLNASLMVRFGLVVSLAAGGYEIIGCWKGVPINFRPYDSEVIGLYDANRINGAANQEILDWFAELLKVVFKEDLSIGKANFGRGEILKLSENKQEDEIRAKLLLWLALFKKTGSKEFAKEVFRRVGAENQHCESFVPTPPIRRQRN